MKDTTEKEITNKTGYAAFISDIDPDKMWINLLAQNLGVNTLFTKPTEGMKKVDFNKILNNVGGYSLAHPILAKAIMLQYIFKDKPDVYEQEVDNGISMEKIYIFKNWSWNPDKKNLYSDKEWISELKTKTYEFPISQWSKLHDMVMTRCLTTHVRDVFYHFQKMSQYGIFLTGLYEVGSVPIEMLRNDR
jgi:hypothetical protein